MKPMISYFGGKWRLSGKMDPPVFDTVIEPFAGGAGYSLRHEPKRVILVEKNPIVAGIWRFLIRSFPEDILKIPLEFNSVDDLDICDDAKHFIGFLIAKGGSSPRKTRSPWARNPEYMHWSCFWSEAGRLRIAQQVNKIKHWEIIEGDYTEAPDIEANWVIDPPYKEKGHKYPTHSLDYKQLSEWCKSRTGCVFVHEMAGADWLPFKPFHTIHTMEGKNQTGICEEVLWSNVK